jgi:Na+-transporting NADH:ubiquinone oxidoreductase subunit E
MGEALDILIKTIFIDNMILAFFLGMCSYLAVSKTVKTAIGLGIAVLFVLVITVPVNWLIETYLLKEGALIAGVDLSFLRLIIFISIIASLVQLVEMLMEKMSPALYNSLGIFLPLITVNCSILGGALFMVAREYNFSQSVWFGVGSGIGWLLAIVIFAAIREKLRTAPIPAPLRGLGIAFILTGLMGMAFMSLVGLNPAFYMGNQ